MFKINNKEIVNQLVKLQILTMRWVERNTHLRCPTHRSMERIITANNLNCTYAQAVDNLKSTIEQHCKTSSYLIKKVLILEDIIKKNNIKDLRFGIETQIKFTKEENELGNQMIKRTLFMLNEMVEIKDAVKYLKLTESEVKQACQQERLLNTRKVGDVWLVHLPECRAYWNNSNTNENLSYKLYNDWIY